MSVCIQWCDFQACVRRRAILSVRANPSCPDEATAEQAVNEVWESCFNDTRPFDEVSCAFPTVFSWCQRAILLLCHRYTRLFIHIIFCDCFNGLLVRIMPFTDSVVLQAVDCAGLVERIPGTSTLRRQLFEINHAVMAKNNDILRSLPNTSQKVLGVSWERSTNSTPTDAIPRSLNLRPPPRHSLHPIPLTSTLSLTTCIMFSRLRSALFMNRGLLID